MKFKNRSPLTVCIETKEKILSVWERRKLVEAESVELKFHCNSWRKNKEKLVTFSFFNLVIF